MDKKKWVRSTGGRRRGDTDNRVYKEGARPYLKFQWSLKRRNDEGDSILLLDIQLR